MNAGSPGKDAHQLDFSKRSPPNDLDHLIVLPFHTQVPDFTDGVLIWGTERARERVRQRKDIEEKHVRAAQASNHTKKRKRVKKPPGPAPHCRSLIPPRSLSLQGDIHELCEEQIRNKMEIDRKSVV